MKQIIEVVTLYDDGESRLNDMLSQFDGKFVRYFGGFDVDEENTIEFVGVSDEKFSVEDLKKEIKEVEVMGIDRNSKEWKKFIK